MKLTEREVQKLIEELDQEKTGSINYQEFLKYSYLVQMYLNHLRLEHMLNDMDVSKKGLITVAQLDQILQK